MKTKEAQYMYRCRYCHKEFPDCYSGAGRTYENLIDAIYNIRVKNQPPVSMTSIHKCNKNKNGIADLIGVRIV